MTSTVCGSFPLHFCFFFCSFLYMIVPHHKRAFLIWLPFHSEGCSPGCLKNSSQICCSFSPYWTIRSWCALARTDQISLPQNSPSNYQEEQGLKLRLPSNILISFPDNSSCRRSRKRKCRALKQFFFTKVESWKFSQVVNFMAQFIFCKRVYSAVELQTWRAVKHAKFLGEQSYTNIELFH